MTKRTNIQTHFRPKNKHWAQILPGEFKDEDKK